MTSKLHDFEKFIVQHCNGTPLPAGLDTRLSELGLDSLDLLDLVLAIENEFKVEVEMAHIDDDATLRGIGQTLFP